MRGAGGLWVKARAQLEPSPAAVAPQGKAHLNFETGQSLPAGCQAFPGKAAPVGALLRIVAQ